MLICIFDYVSYTDCKIEYSKHFKRYVLRLLHVVTKVTEEGRSTQLVQNQNQLCKKTIILNGEFHMPTPKTAGKNARAPIVSEQTSYMYGNAFQYILLKITIE